MLAKYLQHVGQMFAKFIMKFHGFGKFDKFDFVRQNVANNLPTFGKYVALFAKGSRYTYTSSTAQRGDLSAE